MTYPSHTDNEEIVKKRQRSYFLQAIMVSAIVIYVLAYTATVLIMLISVRHTQNVIDDCTNINGDCAKVNQKQTSKVVKLLIDSGDKRADISREYTMASNWCRTREVRQYSDFRKCVIGYVKEYYE